MQPEAGPSRGPQRTSPYKGPMNGPGYGRPRWGGGSDARERDWERASGPSQGYDRSRPPRPPFRDEYSRPPPRSKTPSPPRRGTQSDWYYRDKEGWDRRMDDSRNRGVDIWDRYGDPERNGPDGPSRMHSLPPRELDRLDRDMDRGMDRDRDPRWTEDRYRDSDQMPPNRPRGNSPTKPQPSRPPLSPERRGPRSFPSHTPPSYPGSRIPSASHSSGSRKTPPPSILDEPDRPRINFLGRDFARQLERDKGAQATTNGPGSHPIVITRSTGVPRAHGMMRQSSSPGASSRPREPISSPSSTPNRTIPLPAYAPSDGDLEEGEVVSPSKPPRPFGGPARYEASWNSRPLSRPRQSSWNTTQRSLSPVKRQPSRFIQSVNDIEPPRQNHSVQRDDRTLLLRSPDPNINTAVMKVTSAPSRSGASPSRESVLDLASPKSEPQRPTGSSSEDEPKPDTQKLELSSNDTRATSLPQEISTLPLSRPDTPGGSPPPEAAALPTESAPIPPTSNTPALSSTIRPETPELPPPVPPADDRTANAHDLTEQRAAIESNRQAPTAPPEKPVASPRPVSDQPPTIALVENASLDAVGSTNAATTKSPPSMLEPLAQIGSGTKSTIAERRAVQLRPTSSAAPSPFDDKTTRMDPMPTEESNAETVEDWVEGPPMELDVPEEIKRLKVVAAIKMAQQKARSPNMDKIFDDNFQAAPQESTRIPSETSPRPRNHFRGPTWPLNRTEANVSKLVTVHLEREKLQQVDKVAQLKTDYLQIDKQWKEHCRALDASMELRGPPPPELYATPNAIPLVGTPANVPGLAPTTPGDEVFSSRANRRRGAGDAVATEAEFQEVLLSLQDTAARDPTYRASKTTAVVPDLILDEEKRLRYDDENDLVSDPIAFYDFHGNAEPEWSDEERAIFLRRYLNHPKQFGKIAEGIPNKEAGDCVLYYYRTKKTVDYKGMLASRRGDKKRKVLPIKKGGKSSALLADLERKKPTVDRTHPQGPKSHITPAKSRDLLGSRSKLKDGTTTPASSGRDDEGDSRVPSRAGSEAPSAKAKMRMSMKTVKRPRMSSNPGSVDLGSSMTPGAGPGPGETNPADLLPPVKRAGKRRKVDPADPKAPEDAKPSRRNATNSYWSVEDKRRVKELFKQHNGDTRAIAAALDGKSERQISNYYDAHKEQIDRVDDPAEGRAEPGTSNQTPSHAPRPAARSIYDTHPSFLERQHDPRYREGPQLGTFPSPYHSTSLPAFPEPPKPTPRPGGMPLSSMLNNESTEEAPRPGSSGRYGQLADNASDATVSERDGENGLPRPSPRTSLRVLAVSPLKAAGRLQPGSPEDRRRSSFGGIDRPDLDRHRVSRPYETPRPSWLPREAGAAEHGYPPRPNTVAPPNPYYAAKLHHTWAPSPPGQMDRTHTPPPIPQREYFPGHEPDRPMEYPIPHLAPRPGGVTVGGQDYRRSESPQKWQYGPPGVPVPPHPSQSVPHPPQPPPHTLPPIPSLPPLSSLGDRDILPPLRSRPGLESHKST